ncbi:hypothetical protein VTI74DRAFT_3570 [Chaetomium olivicolor]
MYTIPLERKGTLVSPPLNTINNQNVSSPPPLHLSYVLADPGYYQSHELNSIAQARRSKSSVVQPSISSRPVSRVEFRLDSGGNISLLCTHDPAVRAHIDVYIPQQSPTHERLSPDVKPSPSPASKDPPTCCCRTVSYLPSTFRFISLLQP